MGGSPQREPTQTQRECANWILHRYFNSKANIVFFLDYILDKVISFDDTKFKNDSEECCKIT